MVLNFFGVGVEITVGVIVASWLVRKVVGVERYTDRVTKVNIVIVNIVWYVISCYCPQAGRSVYE